MGQRFTFALVAETVFAVFTRGLSPLYRTSAAVVAPLLVFLLIVYALPLPPWAGAAAGVISALAIVFAWAVLIRVAWDVMAGERPLRPYAYVAALVTKVRLVLGVTIVFYVIEVIGFVLLIIPAIWLGVALSLALADVAGDGGGIGQALATSYRLVHGAYWTSLGANLIAVVLTIAIPAILDLPFLFGHFTTGLAANAPLLTIWTAVVWVVVLPLIPVTLAVLYRLRAGVGQSVAGLVERDRAGQQLTE